MSLNVGVLDQNIFTELIEIFGYDIAENIVKKYSDQVYSGPIESQYFKFKQRDCIGENTYKFCECMLLRKINNVLPIGHKIPVIVVDYTHSTIKFHINRDNIVTKNLLVSVV